MDTSATSAARSTWLFCDDAEPPPAPPMSRLIIASASAMPSMEPPWAVPSGCEDDEES
jgi:hypothetical protein